jgi:dephospho-CoA kinase
MTSCLGGWCTQRENCRYFQNTTGIPIERLCEHGQTDAFQRVIVVKAAPSTQPEKETA